MKLKSITRNVRSGEALDFREFVELAERCCDTRPTVRQMFAVPMDIANDFHHLLRKFVDRSRFNIRRVPRGGEMKGTYVKYCTVDTATHFGYYIDSVRG